ncbi:MAG: ABC transporter permease [Candidatus Dormibacteraeota bacterium]|nr:ABC transporter permease [Candidatus Dormibacteraeota bacterium]MBO0743568.1 ABC transporter permease [Candidatus Dormibacteraeota bacterium]
MAVAGATVPEAPLAPRVGAVGLARLTLRSATATAGVILIVICVLAAVFGPLLYTVSPIAQHLGQHYLAPSLQHPLGTDELGRDILARLLTGARYSLVSAVAVVGSAIVVGTVVGITAGYFGGWWDEAVMRVTDIFLAFPGLILAMAIAAVLHPSLVNAVIAIAVTWWPGMARLMRGQTLAVRNNAYVEAARALGVGKTGILRRHILPNAFTPVLVQATLDVGNAILTVAGLSFIGFGAQPPTPEWGLMVSEGRNFLATQWWIPTMPALAILAVVLGCNLTGDGLRDLLDPHTD